MLIDRYSLFIFDWDGTLATSTTLVKAARLLQTRYKIETIDKQDWKSSESKAKIEDAVKINRFYAMIYELYSTFYRPQLKPGALELLKLLKKKGKKIAIFSDANKHRLFIETKRLGVDKYVDFSLSAASIKKYKPNPIGIKEIVRRLGGKNKQSLYIGDMAVDVYVARFAGIDSCAVSDGVDPQDVLERVGPNHLVKNLKALAVAR